MNKPQLVILEKIGEVPVKGGCSSCGDVVFHTGSAVGVPGERQSKLESLFREHFRKVHMREDASQAAVRIVREATED